MCAKTIAFDENIGYPKSPFIFELSKSTEDYYDAARIAYVLDDDDPIKKLLETAASTGGFGSAPGNYDDPPGEKPELAVTIQDRNEFPTIRNWISSTEIGRNEAINCRWGFCEDDDLIHPLTAIHGKPELGGLGRVYSEVYQNTQQLIHITAGVMQFSSLAQFYLNSFDATSTEAIHYGNSGGLTRWVGKLVSGAIDLAVYVVTMPIRFIRTVGMLLDPSNVVTKYYDIKGAMPLYYKHVDTIITTLAINMGLYPNAYFKEIDASSTQTQGTQNKEGLVEKYTGKDGQGDYSIVETRNPIADPDVDGKLTKIVAARRKRTFKAPWVLRDGPSIWHILTKRDTTNPDGTGDLLNLPPLTEAFYDNKYANDISTEEKRSQWDIFKFRLKRSSSGTDKFVAFRINKSVDSSESLSNQTGETSISQTINSVARSGRDKYVSFQGGNIANIPGVSDVLGMAKDLIGGLLDTFSITGMASSILTGTIFVDIPEIWQSSSFSKSYSFNVTLRAPYGDRVSIFQSIYIPLAMLIALAFPRSGGRNVYGTPFLIRAYSSGMFAIPLGIIDSFSITRGSSEFGWNLDRLPTTVEVSFTIKDLSAVTHLAIQDASDLGMMNILGTNSSFQEYMLTLSGIGLKERLNITQSLARRMQAVGAIGFDNKWANLGAYAGTMYGDGIIGRMAYGLAPSKWLSMRTEGLSEN